MIDFKHAGFNVTLDDKDEQGRPTTKVINIPSHRYEVIENFVKFQKKIPAIKWVRAEYNIGLKNAKDIVDYIDAQFKIKYPSYKDFCPCCNQAIKRL